MIDIGPHDVWVVKGRRLGLVASAIAGGAGFRDGFSG